MACERPGHSQRQGAGREAAEIGIAIRYGGPEQAPENAICIGLFRRQAG
jgi:hypothetical protein